MNVEIGAEATQFPEKENINGVFLVVQLLPWPSLDFPAPLASSYSFSLTSESAASGPMAITE